MLAGVLDDYRRFGPDELIDRVWQTTERCRPDERARAEQATHADKFVPLRPDLFGGGSLCGQFGTAHFTALEAPPVGLLGSFTSHKPFNTSRPSAMVVIGAGGPRTV